MSSQLIFVTGASGFLGTHLVEQLLAKNYRVRAAARGAKVNDLKNRHASSGSAFEAVNISDLATDQFPEHLKGVDAVIHAGSPLAGRGEPDEIFKSAIEGSINVIRQAQKAGIKKIVVTGSIAAISNPKGIFSDTEWNPLTKEIAVSSGQAMAVYAASKKYAEKAIWDLAEAHPELDITVFNPPFLYGPFAKDFEIPEPNFTTISTNLWIFRLLVPTGPFPPIQYIDARDVAKAHILALSAGPSPDGRPKRLPIASPTPFVWTEAIEYLKAKRPEIKDRLPDPSKAPTTNNMGPPDFERLEKVVGMKKGDFVKWEDTILDTVDALLALEKQWKEKGFEVNIPLQ